MPRWGDNPVTFDGYDTLHSAVSKLESSTDAAPVIVLESDCIVADDVLLYRLLARASQRLRAPVAVVTQNPLWRKLAREYGLSAYATMGSLKRARRHSAVSLPESVADSLYSSLLPSLAGHGRTFLAMLTVIATVLGGAGYLFLPVMTVTVRAPVENHRSDIRVRVDSATTDIDHSGGRIPGRIVQHRFTATDFVDVTGSKSVGKDRAAGEVTVINSSPARVDLPSGTILLASSGQKYETVERVSVGPFANTPGASATPTPGPEPEATATPVPTGILVKVPVRAVEPGERGNVPALAISRFESDPLRGLTVFNEAAISGGKDSKVNTVVASDRDHLKEQLFQRAQAQALSELQVRLRNSESLIPHSMQVTIEREEFDKELDEEAKQLRGTVHVLANGMAFANPDLNAFVQAAWEKSVPTGYEALVGDFQIAPPEVVDAAPRTAELKVGVTGRVQRTLESNELAQSLRGLTVREATAKMSGMRLPLQTVSVELWPGWAQRAYRVEVRSAVEDTGSGRR